MLFMKSARPFIGGAAFAVLFIGLFSSTLEAADRVYEKPSAFLKRSFGAVPKTKALTLDSKQQKQLKSILGKSYPQKKIRYWKSGDKVAWILEKKGKSEPITTGFIVKGNALQEVKVLVYRESHGWEVGRPFFTKQFKGATLNGKKVSCKVDGIVGATLSVNALKKLSAAALYLSQQVDK